MPNYKPTAEKLAELGFPYVHHNTLGQNEFTATNKPIDRDNYLDPGARAIRRLADGRFLLFTYNDQVYRVVENDQELEAFLRDTGWL